MQQVRTWRRRNDRRHPTSGLRPCLALLLVLAFVASGFFHALGGDHAAFASTHSHELTSVDRHVGDEPCCPEHDHNGQPHGTFCSMASGCSLCVPVASSGPLALSNAEPAALMPEPIHSGRVLSPQFRPPKLFANA